MANGKTQFAMKKPRERLYYLLHTKKQQGGAYAKNGLCSLGHSGFNRGGGANGNRENW